MFEKRVQQFREGGALQWLRPLLLRDDSKSTSLNLSVVCQSGELLFRVSIRADCLDFLEYRKLLTWGSSPAVRRSEKWIEKEKTREDLRGRVVSHS